MYLYSYINDRVRFHRGPLRNPIEATIVTEIVTGFQVTGEFIFVLKTKT